MNVLDLKAGELVEVRNREEILATLDSTGCLEGMPFMPEMLEFCGRRFRVARRAHKTCDTVNWTGGRSIPGTVHLEDLRCNGTGHGGCQAGCLIFWKEAWIRRVAMNDPPGKPQPVDATRRDAITAGVLRVSGSRPQYRCQATELPRYSTLLPWWDARQYVEDLSSGNISFATLLRSFSFAGFRKLTDIGIGYRALIATYNWLQARRGGMAYPIRIGTLEKTPHEELNLMPGEWVRVKSHDEIVRTLNVRNRNRGLSFDEEMVRFCGGTYRVLRRVTSLVEERTGELITLSNPCIVLEQVYCSGELSKYRLFCPRAIPPYWREIWLERIPAPVTSGR